MSCEQAFSESIRAGLDGIRRRASGEGAAPALVDLAEAAIRCACDAGGSATLSPAATRLPGVNLEGVDRSTAAATLVHLAHRSLQLLSKSLQAVLTVGTADPSVEQLQVAADRLTERVAMAMGCGKEAAERQCQRLEQAIAELRPVAAQLAELRARFSAETSQHGGHAAQIRARLEEKRRALARLSTEEQSVRDELVQTEARIARLEAERGGCAEARSRLQRLESEESQVRHQLDGLRADIADLEGEVGRMGAELCTEQQRSAELHEERIRLQKALDEAKQIVATVAELRSQLTVLESQTKESEGQIASLRKREVEVKARAAELREQLAATRQLIEGVDDSAGQELVGRIRQIWQQLPADAIDQRLQNMRAK
ncbi:MAG TPA: hypothetical protein PKY77_03360 [Phycisphaerae bacterium]|nr:hypothetical protein [Phycisphaerae bacterium]HRY67363.1 hypothetical protein [Phycisphaerae bacterium]HSA29432.1 hypothetical protein [Phycisphaerae bacterium]